MRWAMVVLGVTLAAAAAACSDRTDLQSGATATPGSGSSTTAPPLEAIARVEAAIQKASSYRIAVTASNFVLTQWGGSDSGTVEVDESSGRVRAVLQRTGEGGPYTIIRADGQTVFQRATCREWARIPGGGVGVLEPFLVSKTLAKVSTPSVSQDGQGIVIRGNVEQLGSVTVIVDPATYLPRRLEGRSAGASPVTWVFSDWGKSLDLPAPKPAYDRGPGGNPC